VNAGLRGPAPAALLAVLALAGCRAEKRFPGQPILIICPWGAGGGTDTISRWSAALLERDLGVPVNVVNATGGGGVSGHTRGAVARPDGYTLTMITVEIAMLHWRGLTSISGSDFTPVTLLGRDPAALFVRSDATWKTLRDLEEHVRRSPGALRASGTAEWGIWHLALAGWLTKVGLKPSDANWISINGAKPSLLQLISGGVDVVCCSLPEARPNLDGAQVRCLGLMAEARLPEFPEVPTFREQGVDWALAAWRGLALPRAAPGEAVEKIAASLARISRSEEFQGWMRESGYNLALEGPAEFAATIERTDRELGAILTSVPFRAMAAHRVGPMLVPGLLAGALAIVLATLLASGGLRLAPEATRISRRGVLGLAEVAGWIVLYLVLSEPLGFVITAAGLLVLWMARLGTRLPVAAAVALTLAPAAYQVFAVFFRVPLPRGLLGW
jgi:putative tricarboxylic transport membrane protein